VSPRRPFTGSLSPSTSSDLVPSTIMPAQLPFPLFSPQYPNNDLTESFIPKHITLSNSQDVKIIRRKGLTRQHAVVWEDSSSKVRSSLSLDGSRYFFNWM
jgi:hypothetical protein